jgi:hypothetical protein
VLAFAAALQQAVQAPAGAPKDGLLARMKSMIRRSEST